MRKVIFKKLHALKESGKRCLFDSSLVVVPNKGGSKETIVIDINDVLVRRNSLYGFNENYGAFLYHLSRRYELIALSDSIMGESCLYKYLDPFGCFSYRIFTKEYKEIDFNRDMGSLMVVTPNRSRFNEKNVVTTRLPNLLKSLPFFGNSRNGLFQLGLLYGRDNDCIKSFIKKNEFCNLFFKSNQDGKFLESYEEFKKNYDKLKKKNNNFLNMIVKYLKIILI